MTFADTFYALIPLVNGGANMLLKISISHKQSGNVREFYTLQILGYLSFLIVVAMSYFFLRFHSAQSFVIFFPLNQIATTYMARLFLKESFNFKVVSYELMMLAGLGIFLLGRI